MVVKNFSSLFTCNFTPKGLHIKVLVPNSKFASKIPIEESEFDVNRVVLIVGIPINHLGTQKFLT